MKERYLTFMPPESVSSMSSGGLTNDSEFAPLSHKGWSADAFPELSSVWQCHRYLWRSDSNVAIRVPGGCSSTKSGRWCGSPDRHTGLSTATPSGSWCGSADRLPGSGCGLWRFRPMSQTIRFHPFRRSMRQSTATCRLHATEELWHAHFLGRSWKCH